MRKKERTVPKCIAFVGRIVPIKDVKTFIRACKIVKEQYPDARLYAVGSADEDPEYFKECLALTSNLGLSDELKFLGHVNFKEFLSELDLLVLTSISEAQPLVILEAGAAGIPSVATNVGGCEQLLYGRQDENPPLGQGGIITSLRNPKATAAAILKMLKEPEFYRRCGETMAQRIQKYYIFQEEQETYRKLYKKYMQG